MKAIFNVFLFLFSFNLWASALDKFDTLTEKAPLPKTETFDLLDKEELYSGKEGKSESFPANNAELSDKKEEVFSSPVSSFVFSLNHNPNKTAGVEILRIESETYAKLRTKFNIKDFKKYKELKRFLDFEV